LEKIKKTRAMFGLLWVLTPSTHHPCMTWFDKDAIQEEQLVVRLVNVLQACLLENRLVWLPAGSTPPPLKDLIRPSWGGKAGLNRVFSHQAGTLWEVVCPSWGASLPPQSLLALYTENLMVDKGGPWLRVSSTCPARLMAAVIAVAGSGGAPKGRIQPFASEGEPRWVISFGGAIGNCNLDSFLPEETSPNNMGHALHARAYEVYRECFRLGSDFGWGNTLSQPPFCYLPLPAAYFEPELPPLYCLIPTPDTPAATERAAAPVGEEKVPAAAPQEGLVGAEVEPPTSALSESQGPGLGGIDAPPPSHLVATVDAGPGGSDAPTPSQPAATVDAASVGRSEPDGSGTGDETSDVDLVVTPPRSAAGDTLPLPPPLSSAHR
jgi:hypothetical protein